jgi:hypothetical protein
LSVESKTEAGFTSIAFIQNLHLHRVFFEDYLDDRTNSAQVLEQVFFVGNQITIVLPEAGTTFG